MLKCFMYMRHFFLPLTNHHNYKIMKDAENGKGPGILTLWLCVFFCLCFFSIRESMNADNGKGTGYSDLFKHFL